MKSEILMLIEELPQPLRGYYCRLFVGALDISSVLSEERGSSAAPAKLDDLGIPAVNQFRICLKDAEKLQPEAEDFARRHGEADTEAEFGFDLVEEIADGNPLSDILQDLFDFTVTLLGSGRDGHFADLLDARLACTDMTGDRRSDLVRNCAKINLTLLEIEDG